ncbi:hypothetical protein ACOMHN_009359 [Nucella lapillus]
MSIRQGRQKNGEEVETLEKILDNEVSYEECRTALEETQGDLGQAVKYVRLKQLLSLHLSDVHTCKRALMSNAWDVHRAADHLLTLQHTPSSPSPHHHRHPPSSPSTVPGPTSGPGPVPDPASPESLEV